MSARYPEPYIQYLVHFHGDRDFFECHEVLEEYWKEEPNSPYARIWVGLIQLAVALYHERRGNVAGARKLLAKAAKQLADEGVAKLGLDQPKLQQSIEERRQSLEWETPPPYVDINLPISDTQLLHECMRRCREQGLDWEAPSRTHRQLLHKHALRDRSDLIRMRQQALESISLRRKKPER